MTAFFTALRRPHLWPPALATFLLHGGVVLAGLPILVLPSTVGIATFFGPTSVTPAGPSPSLVTFGAAVGVGLLAWLVLGGLAAAAAEAVLVRATVGVDAGWGHAAAEMSLRRRSLIGLAARILAARALGAFPIVLAVGWSAPRLGAAAYAQLTHPVDPSAAFVLRVVGAAPETLVALAVGWLAASAVGAVAARRIVLLGEGPVVAAWRAISLLARRPIRWLGATILGGAASLALVGGGLLVAREAWLAAGDVLGSGPADAVGLLGAGLLVGGFVAAWSLALTVAGLLGAWRGIDWTAFAFSPAPAAAIREVALVPEPVLIERT